MHTHRKAYDHGLGRPQPAEQDRPNQPMALCTSYHSIQMWRVTRARIGLSPPAGYLSIRGIESHSNMVINPGTTLALTSTTLALRKDTHVYPGP